MQAGWSAPHDALAILGLTPFEHPDAGLCEALHQAGALPILDLGRDGQRAEDALSRLAALAIPFGVRVPEGVAPRELPAMAEIVVLDAGANLSPFASRTVLVQVTSVAEARGARAAGAAGLICKGGESGGRVGEETAFVLLQRLVAEGFADVWVQGGIGVHGAAAAIAGGARGVVLDAQLACLAESALPRAARDAVSAMDGSESRVVRGYRVLCRPDIPVDALAPGLPATLGPGPLHERLLPAGQEAAFARPLAERFSRVAPFVQGVREAIDGHLSQARSLRPLAPGSPFARQHGLRYGIAQGPMTRVSDGAAFAEGVARGGGLPFLALSLMKGAAARALLERTREQLGGLTWGVGILGFVPQELRDEQLEAILAVKAPVALIAGGRPSQARKLEDAGIPTYIHVPSTGLLDLFLKDGARRFVFEGRECGGHVGPRSSFALWESMVEALGRHERPEELSLLFAGGIHDARSAAMVAVLAAPLAALGARIGVLMGTAYLFTREAVASGAILPGFQEQALLCDGTVLLESATGHATRCADTEFAATFRQERERLLSEARPREEVWAELEKLNLGRLRLAAKGIDRRGDNLVAVDEETQRREGMYMIGQVAALRSRVTTIEELHREVAEGSAAFLEGLVSSAPRRTRKEAVDVAIIGMAGFFPGSADLDAFWSHVALGKNDVGPVPEERWNVDLYFDPRPKDGKSRSRWGGFIPDVDFDPLQYGIPPRSLAAIEPVQLLALEAARRALEDAGYGDRDFDRETTSVIFGAEAGTDLAAAYGFRALYPQYLGEMPEELQRLLPRLTEDSFPGVLANVIAGRISNRLDLGGVNFTVDAACASSLAALELACKELLAGTSSMVLCGGADLHNTINDYLMFSSVHALSPQGRSATFDADADGIALGEGVAAIVCKRLSDAEAAGDRIYAVVKGIAGSSDGRSLGLTAPRKEGQVRALLRAYDRSGISPADIGLVEAHGTGTIVGDRIELASLAEVYTRAEARRHRAALGSVKSNVGHTKCTAGIAGVIKVAQALYRRVLPPTLHLSRPNPGWDAETSPFHFRTTAAPWPEATRRAAASAFGFGGTNFHAVLEAHGNGLPPESGLPEWPAELFLFRNDGEVERLAALVAGERSWRLRDLAASQTMASDGPFTLAVVAGSSEELRARLSAARAGKPSPGVHRLGAAMGSLAFLFSGQGSQRPGMMADLFVAFPRLQDLLEPEPDLARLIHPPAAFTPESVRAQRDALTDTRVAQPALGIVELAAARLLSELGVAPDLLAGHSYGELPALVVAGALPRERLVALSRARAEAILEAAAGNPGTMAACAAPHDKVGAVIRGIEGVVIANQNGPRQTVIAGTSEAVARAGEALAREGVAVRPIPVACAFHSPLLARAPEIFASALSAVPFSAPRVPVYANVTAAPHDGKPESMRATLARHLASPVRFQEEIERMYADGARIFVEVGPGRVLTGLVEQILGDRPHAAIPIDGGGDAPLQGLLDAVARLALCGRVGDLAPLFAGRGARRFDLDAPGSAHAVTAWRVNGQRAVPWHGEPPDFALKVVRSPVRLTTALPPPAAAADRESVVLEYLRGVRELAENQRQILLSYLGQASAPLALRAAEIRTIPRPKLPEGQAPVVLEAEVVASDASTAASRKSSPAAPPSRSELESALLAIVSERTGYPPDMLDLDLDLEADLSIDSIKRMEILGQMAERLGLAAQDRKERDAAMEELAAQKSLRRVLDRMAALTAGAASPSAGAAPVEDAKAAATPEDSVPPRVCRYVPVVEQGELGAAVDGALKARTIGIVPPEGELGDALAAALENAGARTVRWDPEDEPPGMDALVHLGCALAPGEPEDGRHQFGIAATLRRALERGVGAAFGVSVLGGRLGHRASGRSARSGCGLGGLLRSISREWPEARVRWLDVDPAEPIADVARDLVTEIARADGPRDVGLWRGTRHVLRYVPADIDGGSAHPLPLDASSLVLLTGGARGITARVAVELARRYGPRLCLLGRSTLPESDEDPAFAGADTPEALRRILVETGREREPAKVEAACRRILAEREMRKTFAAIEAVGASYEYHALDVREPTAVAALVADLYRRHGTVDAVFHGAGVNDDRLLKDKSAESFQRVVDTKLRGALALVRALRDDVRFLVFFSSVAAAFGNRGQVDYAAANDALDQLAHSLHGSRFGRVVSIDWGPWGGGGMVSAELAREYARRGIGLIEPEDGIRALFDELCSGSGPQVVLMRARLERMS